MKRTPIFEADGTRIGLTEELLQKEKPLIDILRSKKLHCHFCEGNLGSVEYDKVLDVEYRTCLKCGHQWQKKYWHWLNARRK